MADIATIERLGDAALLLRFGDGIDAAVNRRVHAWAAALSTQSPDWLTELTPAYASLALHVDVARIDRTGSFEGDPLDAAIASVAARLRQPLPGAAGDHARTLAIPVRYGGDQGPDLAALAAHAGIAIEDVVARHTAADYTVAMLGFAPGFPYLFGLDATLAMPRLSSPRTHVAAGSVGIGGAQTGIYPQAGPGGWRLIGRTPLRLFDPQRNPPSLLQAGDRVRFVAIDADTFAAMAAAAR
jgi:KipI family sensor histidine kinase inhibitor